MRLTLPEVTKLAQAVAAEHQGVTAEAVAASAGDSDYIELLLTVRSAEGESRSVLVDVRRVDPETFRRDLRRRIATALATRRQD